MNNDSNQDIYRKYIRSNLLIYVCLPLNSIGGNYVHLDNIISQVSEIKQYDIVLIISSDEQLVEMNFNKYDITVINVRNRSTLFQMLCSIYVIHKLKVGYEKVLIHSIKSISDIASSLCDSQIHKISTVESELTNIFTNRFKWRLLNWIYGHLVVKRINNFIFIGNGLKLAYEKRYFGIQSRSKVINSGLSNEIIQQLKYICRNIDNSRVIRFGYVGTLTKAKGIYDAISTYLELPINNKALYVYGEGPALSDIEKIENKNIYIKGFERERKNIYDNIDILLFPSYSEGLPWVILEAMYSGILVISRHVGAISDVIIDGHNSYLIDSDLKYKDRALELIRMIIKEDSSTVSLNAHQRILYEFSINKEMIRYIHQYKDYFKF